MSLRSESVRRKNSCQMNEAAGIFFDKLRQLKLIAILKDSAAELAVLVKIRNDDRTGIEDLEFRFPVIRNYAPSYCGKIKISRLGRTKNI